MQGYVGMAALDNIAVTNIQPGPVATSFVAGMAADTERAGASGDDSEATELEKGMRNLAKFNAERLAKADMTAQDVADVVMDVIEKYTAGENVPLSVPVGAGAIQVSPGRVCRWMDLPLPSVITHCQCVPAYLSLCVVCVRRYVHVSTSPPPRIPQSQAAAERFIDPSAEGVRQFSVDFIKNTWNPEP